MAQMLVHIKASVGFLRLSPQELIVQARKVHDSMADSPLYGGAPIDAPTLSGAYIASIAEATDRSGHGPGAHSGSSPSW